MPRQSDIRAAVTGERFATRLSEIECRKCGVGFFFLPGQAAVGMTDPEFLQFAERHAVECHGVDFSPKPVDLDRAEPVYL